MQPPTTERQHAYLLLRLFTGLDFFMHGFARIFTGSHLGGFAESMARSMATTPLPARLLLATGYAIPCVELFLGTLLLLGLWTRAALMLAFLLMFVLLFGVTLKQDWTTAGTQLVYAAVLFALLYLREGQDRSWRALVRGA